MDLLSQLIILDVLCLKFPWSLESWHKSSLWESLGRVGGCRRASWRKDSRAQT